MVAPMRSVWNIAIRNNRNFFRDLIRQRRGGVEIASFRGMIEDEIVAVGFRPREESKGILAKMFFPGHIMLDLDDVVVSDNRDGAIEWRVLTASTGRTYDPHDTAYLIRGDDYEIEVTVRVWRVLPDSTVVTVGDYPVFIVYEHRVPVVGDDAGAYTRSMQVRLVSRTKEFPAQRGDGFMTMDEDLQGKIIDVRELPTRIEAVAEVTRGFDAPEL